MDRGSIEKQLDTMSTRLENTIQIIMEHLRDTEDRLEAMEKEVKDALSKDVSE